MKKLTATHIIPLIAPFIAAANKNGIETKYVYSFNAFKDNEQHIPLNYKHEVTYLPDKLIGQSVDKYKMMLAGLRYKPTDFVFAVPPCAGLSMMTSGADQTHRDSMNQWIFEAVKFFLASGSKMLCFENAFELTHAAGITILRKLIKLIPPEYKLHVIRCTSLNHGLPQHRRRCFVYIYKSDVFKLPYVKSQPHVAWEDFLQRPEEYNFDDPNNLHIPSSKVFKKFHVPMKKFKVYKELRDHLKSIERRQLSLFRYIRTEVHPKEIIADKKSPLYKLLVDIRNRRACWDSSPLICKSYIGAVTKKNCMSLIHPRFDRPLSYREIMDLMGLPENFKMVEPIKFFNCVCQNIPLPTVTAYVKAAVDMLKGKTSTFKSDRNLLLQDNVKQRFSVLDKHDEWEDVTSAVCNSNDWVVDQDEGVQWY